jgi:hypothetical protein
VKRNGNEICFDVLSVQLFSIANMVIVVGALVLRIMEDKAAVKRKHG